MSDEEILHCPYNHSHVILKSRMAGHLQKCREHYPLEKYTTCPFNATHDVPAPELKYHTDTCPDRKTMENYLYVMDDEKEEEEEPEAIEIQAGIKENWDEEKVSESYLEVKNKILPETKIIKAVPPGRSKSEKKAFSQSQVKKFSSEKPSTSSKTVKSDPLKFAFLDKEPQPVASGSGVRKPVGEEEEFKECVKKSKKKGASRGISMR